MSSRRALDTTMPIDDTSRLVQTERNDDIADRIFLWIIAAIFMVLVASIAAIWFGILEFKEPTLAASCAPHKRARSSPAISKAHMVTSGTRYGLAVVATYRCRYPTHQHVEKSP